MKDRIFEKLQKEIPGVQKNVLLKLHTTYKIGGPAKYFFISKTTEELIKGIQAAKELKLPLFIFSGGSNLLISDKGLKGLVIKIENSKIKLLDNNLIYVEAGVSSNKLTKFVNDNSLTGMEWMAGIPGTVGGAIYGNAQAFGAKMSDNVLEVEALDLKTLKIKKLFARECGFALKNSVFKKKRKLIILSVVLKLKKGNKEEIQEKVKEYISYRKKNHPIAFPSAGSVFVNPEIVVKNKALLKKYPELAEFAKKGYIHAGYLIEKVGLKGKKVGGAQISEKHANFIINKGNAKAKDVKSLIEMAKKAVKEVFKIVLEQEVQEIGFSILESIL